MVKLHQIVIDCRICQLQGRSNIFYLNSWLEYTANIAIFNYFYMPLIKNNRIKSNAQYSGQFFLTCLGLILNVVIIPDYAIPEPTATALCRATSF